MTSPTLVLKDGKPTLVTGSLRRRPESSPPLQTVVNTIDFGNNPAEAAAAPACTTSGRLMSCAEKGLRPTRWPLSATRPQHRSEAIDNAHADHPDPQRDASGYSDPRNPDGRPWVLKLPKHLR